MRTGAVWLLGLLASVILGSLLGLSLWQAGLGSAAWGVAASALVSVLGPLSPAPRSVLTLAPIVSSNVVAPPPSKCLVDGVASPSSSREVFAAGPSLCSSSQPPG